MGDSSVDRILYVSIIIYILMMMTFALIKPKFAYDDMNKKLRPFGFDEHETLFALPILSILLCIFVYIIVLTYTCLLSMLK